MNLRNNDGRRSANLNPPKYWAFRFPLDCLERWFWALPSFQWHKQRRMQLYWEEHSWSDWELSKLSWGLEAFETRAELERNQILASAGRDFLLTASDKKTAREAAVFKCRWIQHLPAWHSRQVFHLKQSSQVQTNTAWKPTLHYGQLRKEVLSPIPSGHHARSTASAREAKQMALS